MVDEVVLKVAKRRMQDIKAELPHPDIVTHFSMAEDGSGRIDLFYQDKLIGQEIIETSESWRKKDRLFDYQEVLKKKVRLAVLAPQADAMKVRMMMLELNNWWLFYYMVYGYDPQGRLVRVLRPAPPVDTPSYIV